jgi:hypothetical protein
MPKDCTKEQVLAARVAAGETVAAAAESVGWSPSRAYRITSTPDFKRQVAEIRTQAVSAAVGSLTEAAKEAVDALRAALKSDKPSDQIAAAKAILASLAPISELAELRQRIDDIENRSPMRITA